MKAYNLRLRLELVTRLVLVIFTYNSWTRYRGVLVSDSSLLLQSKIYVDEGR